MNIYNLNYIRHMEKNYIIPQNFINTEKYYFLFEFFWHQIFFIILNSKMNIITEVCNEIIFLSIILQYSNILFLLSLLFMLEKINIKLRVYFLLHIDKI